VSSLVKGLVIGFSIAAPVGPIGLLCLRCTLAHGRLNGFLCGLGAATADAIYGATAAFGLSAVTSLLLGTQMWLQLGGGLFLLWLGVKTLRAAPPAPRSLDTPAAGALVAGYFSTLALTLANPMTILSFLGIFAGLGLGAVPDDGSGRLTAGALSAGWLVLGVFFGSATWWLMLSSAAGWLGRRLSGGGFRTVNVASGLIIAGFGLWQLGQLARTRF
jgi:threonine/homoserine/homoserine lactone efflux protein